MKLLSFPILSLITDSSVYQNKEKMVNNITQTTKVGVNMVQIREKNLSNEEKKKLIQKIIVKSYFLSLKLYALNHYENPKSTSRTNN